MKNHGSLEDFRLVLHGTAEAPHHMKAGPRIYDENYNTVQNERSVRTNSQTIDISLISVFFSLGKTSKFKID
jgi:hypothetical protein